MAFNITKTVRPNAIWQEMYLKISINQRVILSADGIWSPEMRPETIVWCGPDGLFGRIAEEGYLAPGGNLAALVGKIGENSPPLAIGNYFDFYSPYEGTLFLAMNERSDYYNQAGFLKVQIILFDL